MKTPKPLSTENFKNMEELMKHLLSGGAITNLDDSCKNAWVSFYNGNLCYPDREEPVTNLYDPTSWRPVPVKWLTDKLHQTTKKVVGE